MSPEDSTSVEAAVRRVLHALSLDPAGFRFDAGFVLRARRSGQLRRLALGNVNTQLVFAGLRASSDPAATAAAVAAEAIALLDRTPALRVEGLIVAWTGSDGRAFAAAYEVSQQEGGERLLGTSWTAPESWPVPMIDAEVSTHQALSDALQRLHSSIEQRSTRDAATLEAESPLRCAW